MLWRVPKSTETTDMLGWLKLEEKGKRGPTELPSGLGLLEVQVQVVHHSSTVYKPNYISNLPSGLPVHITMGQVRLLSIVVGILEGDTSIGTHLLKI